METNIWLWLVMALMSISAYSSTDCCQCIHRHPQEVFCNSGFVIHAKLLRANITNMVTKHGINYRLIQYEIETLKVFKGGSEIQYLKFIHTETQSGCDYYFSPDEYNKDHLITGVMENGRVDLDSCNYIVAWSQLSEGQKKGMEGAYWCDCKIWYPFDYGADTSNSCQYDPLNPRKIHPDPENQMCAPNENGKCTWQPVENLLLTSSTSDVPLCKPKKSKKKKTREKLEWRNITRAAPSEPWKHDRGFRKKILACEKRGRRLQLKKILIK